MKNRYVGICAAGFVLASAPVLLTLNLNPERRLSEEAIALAIALLFPYFVSASLLIGALSAVFRLFQYRARLRKRMARGMEGFTHQAFFAVAGSAALFWWNLWQYRHSIPIDTARGIASAAVLISVAAVVILTIAVDAFLFPARSRGLGAPLVVLAAAMPVIAPLLLRAVPAPLPPPLPLRTAPIRPLRRIVLIGMDGIGWPDVCDQVARGNLPAFRTILRNGSYGPLATLRPTEGPPIWTTIVSGKLPRDHGVKSFIAYQLRGSKSRYELLPRGVFIGTLQRIGLVSVNPVSASARRVKTLWNALNAFGIEVGIVRLWGTHPVEKVRGFMLSHYFHALPTKRLAEALYPMTLIQEVTAKRVSQADLDSAFISQFVDINVTAANAEYPWWQQDLMRDALSPDLTYLRAGSVLREAYDPPFFATYFFGLDVVGHSFLRYARPEQFGDVSPAEVRRYGHVRDRYMAFLGQVVAETIDRLRDDEVLIVLSAYGMRPVSLWRRVVASMSGAKRLSGTHANAPDGFIALMGRGVHAHKVLESASVLDVTPTVLYLMGLPVARDMQGRILTEAIQETFTRDHPVSFIPSYESLDVAPLVDSDESDLPPLDEEER